MTIIVRSMYNFVNCLQFNIRDEKVERSAPVGSALVSVILCLSGLIYIVYIREEIKDSCNKLTDDTPQTWVSGNLSTFYVSETEPTSVVLGLWSTAIAIQPSMNLSPHNEQRSSGPSKTLF
jgi:NADH:ubiquinone oxidoreductase subunit 6 (subunit J)